MPSLVQAMRDRLETLKLGFWRNTYVGRSACPDDFEDIAGEYVDEDAKGVEDACGCFMAQHNYNHFAGPYVDMEPGQMHDAERLLADVQGKVQGEVQDIEQAAEGGQL